MTLHDHFHIFFRSILNSYSKMKKVRELIKDHSLLKKRPGQHSRLYDRVTRFFIYKKTFMYIYRMEWKLCINWLKIRDNLRKSLQD